jgi:CRP-like cAMP-binding protein
MISPELLRHYGCFGSVADETLKAVAMIAEQVSVPAETQVFREKDPADALRIIVEGEVDLQCALDRHAVRTIDTLITGDLLGWSAMVEPYRMTTSAISRKPTRLIRIDAKALRELCTRDHWLGYQLMQGIASCLTERLEAARVQLGTKA